MDAVVAAAAEVAAVAAAAGSVASGSVPAWLALVALLARAAADPGERAACAKSRAVVTVGGSLPVYPNNQDKLGVGRPKGT